MTRFFFLSLRKSASIQINHLLSSVLHDNERAQSCHICAGPLLCLPTNRMTDSFVLATNPIRLFFSIVFLISGKYAKRSVLCNTIQRRTVSNLDLDASQCTESTDWYSMDVRRRCEDGFMSSRIAQCQRECKRRCALTWMSFDSNRMVGGWWTESGIWLESSGRNVRWQAVAGCA